MYFKNFPKLLYSFYDKTGLDYEQKLVTDITFNVRIKKALFDKVIHYDTYYIQDYDTPELIAEKIYGNPEYHWVVMLSNDYYNYINDFPIDEYDLSLYIEKKYGTNSMYKIHHYTKDGVESQPEGYFILEEAKATLLKTGDYITSDNGLFIEVKFVDKTKVYVKIYTPNLLSSESPDKSFTCTIKRSPTNGIMEDNTFQLKMNDIDVLSSYTPVTNYDYEIKLNDIKREIKVVSPKLINQLAKEFNQLIREANGTI